MDMNKEIIKLEQMRDELYDISRTIKLANEELKSTVKEEIKLYLGEITESPYGPDISVLILAKTESEATEKVCKFADEHYNEYGYLVSEVELNDYCVVDMNCI